MPQPPQPLWPARMALAAVLVVLVLASLSLWQQLKVAQQERIGERMGYQARSLGRQLEAGLSTQVVGLRRVARLWNYRGRIPKGEWTLICQLIQQHFKGYQAIQWLDADLRLRWMEPLRGNEEAQGFRLTPAHPNFNLAMQAKAAAEPHFSRSVPLLQGGNGFILYIPLYIRDQTQAPVFDGFLQGVFRVEKLMDELIGRLDSEDFGAALLEDGVPLYSRVHSDGVTALRQEVPLRLLNNQSLTLRLTPSKRLVQSLSTPLPQFVLGASLAISLLLVAALALALENARRAGALQSNNRRLNEEIIQRQQTEQGLRDSRERLQLVLDLTDSSRDGLFIIDPASREILHMNRATHNALGYSAEAFAELFRRDPERLLPGYHDWLNRVRQALQDNQSTIFQQQLRRRDGSIQAAEIRAQIVQRHGREYLIGVSRDNSERLKLEAELQRLTQLDGLTGLYNRRFFDNQLASEWRRLRRQGAPLTLLMLDIDHFKAYNDQFGHLAGDDALRRVGRLLNGCLQREGDVACRYGGEEFAIILADTDLDGGAHVAEQVHQQLAALNLAHPASPLGRMSLSIGQACLEPSEDNQPEQLIERADQALYQAKRQGRNRTCVWQPG